MALSPPALIDRMDHGLKRYYEMLKRNDYWDEKNSRGLFKRYCEGNELDADQLKEEFDVEVGADQMDLLEDFICIGDEDCEYWNPKTFPCLSSSVSVSNTAAEQKHKMFEVLKQIYDYDRAPKALKEIHDFELSVTPQNVSNAKALCRAQIYDLHGANGMNDTVLLEFFAIGLRNKDLSFCSHAVSSFMRDQLAAMTHKKHAVMITNLHVNDWMEQNAFLRKLRQFNERKAKTFAAAVRSYMLRITPTWQFKQKYVIHDDVSQVAKYIAVVTQFIKMLVVARKTKPPFMIDFLIAVRGAQEESGGVDLPDLDDSDDDDDDDDDNDDEYEHKASMTSDTDADKLGDICSKLKHENCAYITRSVECDALYKNSNDLYTMYTEFTQHMKASATFPTYKRFNIVVDRRIRTKKTKDDLIFFQPPPDCYRIPKQEHMPESCFAASRKCLIPEPGYNAGKGCKDTSIHMESELNGQLLTFSFHVESKNEIKCFMIFDGQVTRFYPQDVFDVLPNLFSVDYGTNSDFLKNEMAKNIAKSIWINDLYFEMFYRSFATDQTFPKKFS